jgi:hypothetical protein
VALSEDQRALLRLLDAGDTPEQVAKVLGTTPEDVRRRAEEARAELGLAGGSGATRLPQRWGLWTAAAGAAVVVLVVVLVVAGGGGGGGDETTTVANPDREDVVPIELSSVGGARANGRIAVVRASGDQPAVDLAIQNLDPSGPDKTYVLWFVGSGGRSLPVAFRAVGSDGQLTGRAAIPTAAASLLPSFDTAELTLAGQRQASAAVRRAAQSDTLPQPVGTVVMRGALR